MPPLDYTPPGLAEAIPGAVQRRQVFYVPGYDPEGRTRYRMLFVREFSRYAKRFGLPKPRIGSATLSPDGLVQSWSVGPEPTWGGTRTDYDVLLWDDLVTRDFARSRFVSAGLLVLGTLQVILTGLIVRFYRLNWKYGNVILYPFVLLMILGLGTGVIAGLVHAHLGDGFGHSLGWPLWATVPLGLVVGLGWIKAIEALLNRAFFWQLLNDWVFNWQHGQGWRPDYAARLDAFADHVLARLAGLAAEGVSIDEVMLVGHSSGAMTAVEVAARVLARDPALGTGAANFALVTLGSGLPLVALQPRATRLRAEIAALCTSHRVVWVDYQAPQDWMNFPGFNPLQELDLALDDRPATNPLIRSARFREIISPETYYRVRWRPFRMHFQFLMANDRRGAYDIFAMTLGSQRLREWVLNPDFPPDPPSTNPAFGAALSDPEAAA